MGKIYRVATVCSWQWPRLKMPIKMGIGFALRIYGWFLAAERAHRRRWRKNGLNRAPARLWYSRLMAAHSGFQEMRLLDNPGVPATAIRRSRRGLPASDFSPEVSPRP